MPRQLATTKTSAALLRQRQAHQQALRDALLETVDKLHRRRASDIPDGLIDDYVQLDWLEWHGGGLRLTTTGQNLCRQLSGLRS